MTERVSGESKEDAPTFKKSKDLKEGDVIKISSSFLERYVQENYQTGSWSEKYLRFFLNRDGGLIGNVETTYGVMSTHQIVDGESKEIPAVIMHLRITNKPASLDDVANFLLTPNEKGEVLDYTKEELIEEVLTPRFGSSAELKDMWKFSDIDPEQSFEVLSHKD